MKRLIHDISSTTDCKYLQAHVPAISAQFLQNLQRSRPLERYHSRWFLSAPIMFSIPSVAEPAFTILPAPSASSLQGASELRGSNFAAGFYVDMHMVHGRAPDPAPCQFHLGQVAIKHHTTSSLIRTDALFHSLAFGTDSTSLLLPLSFSHCVSELAFWN